jgi:chloramphenicol O-acetyltransferase type B
MKDMPSHLYRLFIKIRKKLFAAMRPISLRHSMVSCGTGCSISYSAKINDSVIGNSVEVGDLAIINGCHLGSNISLQRSCEIIKCNIGSYSYLSTNARLIVSDIGMFSSIGPNVVCGCGDHPTDWLSTSPVFYSNLRQCGSSFVDLSYFNELKKVQIGHDCWIGANVVIKNGVNIGHGAIIAAGAVVITDVPSYAIVAGIPAKLVRFRFDIDMIDKLIESKWWLMPPEFLRANSDIFRQCDVTRLIDKISTADSCSL